MLLLEHRFTNKLFIIYENTYIASHALLPQDLFAAKAAPCISLDMLISYPRIRWYGELASLATCF